MGNDLNFDELDNAVSSYMQKDPSPEEPAASTIKVEVVAPKETASIPKPIMPAPATPKIQIQTRQSLAGRRASRGTFHDIIPARPSPAKPVAVIAPPSVPAPSLAKVTPSIPIPPPAPAASAKPATPIVPAAPVLDVPQESALPVAAPSSPIAVVPPTPHLPVEAVKVPEEPLSATPAVSFEDLVEDETPKILSEPTPDISSEENAQKTPLTAPIPSVNHTEVKGADAGDGKPSEGLAHQKIDFADDSDKEPPTGLLETGELHTALPSTIPSSPAQLEAAAGDEQPLQVFDTKEYHTPITGGGVPEASQKSSHEKMWEWIIIILLIVVALIGGVVAYTMLVKG